MPLTRMPPVRAIAGLVILRYDNLMVLLCSGAVRTSATCGRGDAQVKNGCSATSRNSQENHRNNTISSRTIRIMGFQNGRQGNRNFWQPSDVIVSRAPG